MTRKKVIAAVFAAILISLAGIWLFTMVRIFLPGFVLLPARPAVHLGAGFAADVQDSLANYGFVDFSLVADFVWTHMLIVTPYQDPAQVMADAGMPRRRLRTNVRFSDISNLIIFANGRRVAAYVDISRGIADFSLPMPYGSSFQHHSAIFYVTMPLDFWHGWHTTQLAQWPTGEPFPLGNPIIAELRDMARSGCDGFYVFIQPDVLSNVGGREDALMPFAPWPRLLDVCEQGIVVEVATLTLHRQADAPVLLQIADVTQEFQNGYWAIYSGAVTNIHSTTEYLGDGWWAVVAWWQGVLRGLSEE